jgi:hypothetical protein
MSYVNKFPSCKFVKKVFFYSWKVLHHASHPLPVMQRLLVHLRNTSRSLRWKVEMHNQLRLLAMEEHEDMTRRLENREYEEWKGARKERLDKLYEVRETFLLRAVSLWFGVFVTESLVWCVCAFVL